MAENRTNEPSVLTAFGGHIAWRRLAVEGAGYVFVAWAALVACNVFAFIDPASRSAASDNLARLPQILTHIPRNFGFVFALIVILAAPIGAADAILRACRIPSRDAFERIAFGAAGGLALLTAVAYLLASLHLLRAAVEWPLLVAGLLYTGFSIRRWVSSEPRIPDAARVPRFVMVILSVVLAASLYVALLAALTPEVGFDARYYHLTAAERYAQHGGFYNLVATERVWAFALPHYEETLYAFGWVVFGAIGAKLLAWGTAVVTVASMMAFARAWFASTAVGVMASVVLFASPVIVWSATTANNDLAAAPLVVLALHLLLVWRRTGGRGALCAAGALAGFTYGIKPFGAFTLTAMGMVIAATLIARRAPRPALFAAVGLFAACGVIALLPALATATWMVGDPLFPFATSVFHSQFGAAQMGANLSNTVASSFFVNLAPVNLVGLPWSLTVDSLSHRDLAGPIWLVTLPLWGALPFFARRGADVIRPVASFVVVFAAFVVVSGAVEVRYFTPVLPVVALLIGYALFAVDWSVARTLQTVVVTTVIALAALDNGLVTRLQWNSGAPTVMGSQYLLWPYVYGDLPESAVQLQYVPIFSYMNQHLDPLADRVYDGANVHIMNMYSEIELYNGVGYGGPASLNEWSLTSPDAYQRLRDAGCTYVVVPATDVAKLKAAPIWRHLKFVVETPSPDGPTVKDDLFKLAD